MGKINLANFGSRSSKLQQHDLPDAFAILTVASVEQRTVPADDRDGGHRDVLVLRFKETGEKTLWLNWPKEIQTIMAQLGDDADAWVGQQVPIERVTREYKGQQFKKVAIADAAKWRDLLKHVGITPTPIPQLEVI